jgi:hypothetical protein
MWKEQDLGGDLQAKAWSHWLSMMSRANNYLGLFMAWDNYSFTVFSCCQIHAGFMLGLLFDHEDVPLKHQLTFTRLHGVISQKTEFFIVTDVRTSNPKDTVFFHKITVY